jgi:hypothetical protein
MRGVVLRVKDLIAKAANATAVVATVISVPALVARTGTWRMIAARNIENEGTMELCII